MVIIFKYPKLIAFKVNFIFKYFKIHILYFDSFIHYQVIQMLNIIIFTFKSIFTLLFKIEAII